MPDKLHVGALEGGELRADAFVDAQCTLAPANQQHYRFAGVDTEIGGCFLTVTVAVDVATKRVAGEMDLLFREPLLQTVVGNTDGAGFLADVAVGLARVGVLLLDDGRDMKRASGFQRGATGEATYTDHSVRLELLQDSRSLIHAVENLDGQEEGFDALCKPADPQPFNRIACFRDAVHLHASFGADK